MVTEYWCNVSQCSIWAALQTRRWHYIEYYGHDARSILSREAYRLDQDRFELHNVIGDHKQANNPREELPAPAPQETTLLFDEDMPLGRAVASRQGEPTRAPGGVLVDHAPDAPEGRAVSYETPGVHLCEGAL